MFYHLSYFIVAYLYLEPDISSKNIEKKRNVPSWVIE